MAIVAWELGCNCSAQNASLLPEPVSMWPLVIHWFIWDNMQANSKTEIWETASVLRPRLQSPWMLLLSFSDWSQPFTRPTQIEGEGQLTLLSDMGSHISYRDNYFETYFKPWKNFKVGFWKFWCPGWESMRANYKGRNLALLSTKLFSRLRENWFYKNNSGF